MTDLIVAPRGTHDIFGTEVELWQLMEQVAADLFRRYAYHEIRVPVFEATELFARGIGSETDIVGKEMYTFLDRGGRSISLRPEATAGIVRAFNEHKLFATALFPLRLWYQGPMFRYERPQKGRYRQLHQLGVEVFGAGEPTIDGEVIALAWDFYQELFAAMGRRFGLSGLGMPQLEVRVNSLGDRQCRPVYRSALQEYFSARTSDYCQDCQRRMLSNPLRVLDCKVPGCQEQNAQAPRMQLCRDCEEHASVVRALLTSAAVRFRWDEHLVRGLDYYTRTVFEIVPQDAPNWGQSTVCGGGRYDGLVRELGGPDTPAIGWALGQERSVDLLCKLAKEGNLTQTRARAMVAALSPQAEAVAFKLAQDLRHKGLAVDLAPAAGKPGKHIKHAERLGARWVLLLGEDELARGDVTVKDLNDWIQRRLPADAAVLAAELG